MPTALSRLCKTILIIGTKSWLLFYRMNISEVIANYFHEFSYGKWNLFGCFNSVLTAYEDITSEDCEKIKEKLRCRLRSISTHNSMSHNKANKLLGELDQFFQSKRVKGEGKLILH